MKILETINDSFFEFKPYAYKNNIKSFNEFIESKCGDEDALVTYLQGIRTKNLLESLEYYIEMNGVTSQDAAFKHSTAIKEYIYFILENTEIKNRELQKELDMKTHKEQSYTFKMNEYILEREGLEDRIGFDIFTTDEIEELIAQCNDLLSSKIETTKLNMKLYNKIRSAIIVKLILLTGSAYRTICSLNRADLNIENSIICINNYEIRLPALLKENLLKYLEISRQIEPDTEALFIEFNGKNMSTNTRTLSYFMKVITGRGDLNGLIKYAITNMLKAGVNERIIMEFTGIKKDILNYCYEEIYNESIKNRELDSKIRALEIYDNL